MICTLFLSSLSLVRLRSFQFAYFVTKTSIWYLPLGYLKGDLQNLLEQQRQRQIAFTEIEIWLAVFCLIVS